MKQGKLLIFAASVLALGAMVACDGGATSSGGGTAGEITEARANEIIAGFTGSVNGTVSLTYNASYNVDVDTNGGTSNMDSFKHQVRDVTTADIDLTAGSLYLKVSKQAQDLLLGSTTSKTEALVYQEGTSYYYLTSTMENPVALASESVAKEKIGELLQSVSYNLGGNISLDTLTYDSGNEYQWREFGLSSTAVEQEWWNNPYYYGETEDGGLIAKTKAEYIGYNTDSGVSDFSNSADGYAADIEVTTNSSGAVVSYVETYNNASLDFAIMTPAPTVIITGSRSFSATYGATLSKATTIDHELTYGTVSWSASNYGDYNVYTCDPADVSDKTLIASGDQVKVGDLLAVKVLPAGTNTVKAVTYNNKSVEVSDDGYYYFEIVEGSKTLSVNFNGTDTKEDAQWATVTSIEKGEHVLSVSVGYMNYPDTTVVALDELNRAPVGNSNFLVISAEYEEGYELDAITVNGESAVFYGAWCYSIKTEGTYEVSVTAKATAAENEYYNFTVDADDGVESVSVYTMEGTDPTTMVDVTADGKAEVKAGRWICFKPTLKDGYEIASVRINEADGFLVSGFYCFKGETAGDYTVNIRTKAAGSEDVSLDFEFTLNTDAGVKSASVWTLDNFNFSGMVDVTSAGKAEAKSGRYFCVKVEVNEGYEVASVKIGDTAGALQGGFYCFLGETAGTYTITITTQAA